MQLQTQPHKQATVCKLLMAPTWWLGLGMKEEEQSERCSSSTTHSMGWLCQGKPPQCASVPLVCSQVILALQQFAVGVGKHPGTPRGKGGRVQPCREALRVFLLIASRIELLKPCTLLLLLRVRDSEASLCWFLLHLTS